MAKSLYYLIFTIAFISGAGVAAGKVETLIVSCIDYRLRTEVENEMVHMYGNDGYDELALPGAALGMLNDQFKDWNKAFTQQLDVAIKLHDIKVVSFVDHEDCGAYKTILKSDAMATHEEQMKKVRAFMKTKYPNIKVETYIMQLDGHVKGLGSTKDPQGQAH